MEVTELIKNIRERAAATHAAVNQFYDDTKPYSYHLNMVADLAMKYADYVCTDAKDYLPLVFGAYFHDSIEDARLTYNDVVKIAREYMDDARSHVAAEIVYALTNDKGRTRAERAGEKYYAGIRCTPYAPFVKLCDRMANMAYSFRISSMLPKEDAACTNAANAHMKAVYKKEFPHFIEALDSHSDDRRLQLPQTMVDEVRAMLSDTEIRFS